MDTNALPLLFHDLRVVHGETPVTVWGVAHRVGGISRETTHGGRYAGGHSYDQLDRDLPPRGSRSRLATRRGASRT